MMTVLTDEQENEFVNRGFSRRHFGRLSAMTAAGLCGKPGNEIIEALRKEKFPPARRAK